MPSTLHPPPSPHFRPTSPRRVNSMPTSPSSTSSSPHLHPTFAPPFYNRPPTPLPPSPSLTSLLRPAFTPSRPTTPDSSDSEAITSHLSTSSSQPSPKVPPTYEYYGFMLYVLSNLSAIIYLIWAFFPAEVLGGALGVTYYPSRWWSLAIPAYLVAVVVYIYVALAAWNTGYLTRPLESLEAVTDRGANIAAVREEGEDVEGGGRERVLGSSERWGDWGCGKGRGMEDWKTLWSRGTDAVMDVPIGGVCEVLYGEGGVWEEEDRRKEEL